MLSTNVNIESWKAYMTNEGELIETEIADFWMDGDVVYIKFKPTTRHSIEEAHLVVNIHNQLSNGKKTPVLADLLGITTGADRKARKYYVGEKSSEFKLGMAMLVTSPFQRMLGNIFLALGSPPYPTKLFETENAGLEWLAGLGSSGDL